MTSVRLYFQLQLGLNLCSTYVAARRNLRHRTFRITWVVIVAHRAYTPDGYLNRDMFHRILHLYRGPDRGCIRDSVGPDGLHLSNGSYNGSSKRVLEIEKRAGFPCSLSYGSASGAEGGIRTHTPFRIEDFKF